MSVDTAPTPEESDTRPAVGGTPFIGGVTTFIDLETGLETAFAWDEIVRNEDARYARYGRPAAVVVAELDRLDALADRFGPAVADRLIPPVAATLRRQSRRSDRIARVGHARFCVLLSETDEVRAINYVDRVREACDVWLESAAVSVRLVVGWASAGPAGTVADAVRIAEQRMYADRLPGGSRRSVVAPLDVAPPAPAPEPTPVAPAPAPAPEPAPAPAAVAPPVTPAPVTPAPPATPTAVYVQPPTAPTTPVAAPDHWPPTTSAAPYAFSDAPAATPDDAPGGEDGDALRHD